MKKVTATQYEENKERIRKEMDAEAMAVVMVHRKSMMAIRRNAGARDAYNAFQDLLPFRLRLRVPAFIPPNYLVFDRDWEWRREAKKLYKLGDQINELMETDSNLVEAYEQYKIFVGLAKE